MARLTFQTLIEHNRRVSKALVCAVVALMSILGAVIALGYAGYHDRTFAYQTLWFGALIGGLLAAAGSLISYYGGNFIVMNIADGRAVEHCDDPVLCHVAAEMALAAGLPPPRIFAIPDESPNAMATGRDPKHALIAITTGLRKKLNRDELQAVVAHEMAHIKNYDTRLMMLVGVFAGMIVLFSDFYLRTFLQGFKIEGGRRAAPVSWAGKGFSLMMNLVFLAAALSLAWLAPFIARLLQLAVSREREYLADATAVQFCRNPLALAEALRKMAVDPAPLRSNNRATQHMYILNPDPKLRIQRPDLDSVWLTHPPVLKRIARLRAMAGEGENRH